MSSKALIGSGVVQGSCLGPVLFLLYVNDLVDILYNYNDTKMKLYADDVKLYSNMPAACNSAGSLQNQLDRLWQWSVTWQLPISYMKCCALSIGKTSRDCLPLLLGQHVLPIVNEVSDLGIVIDNNLKFSCHVNKIVSKAHRRANLILRCFVSRDSLSLTKAFKVYVRPILEYCSVVWCPHLVKDIEAIEKVQRRFTKRLPGMQSLSYFQRLRKLGIESLELRRIRNDLLFAYKIIFGLVDTNMSDFFTTKANENRPTRGHRFKLTAPTTKNSVRYNYFSNRTMRIWNGLPADKVNFSSLSNFKRCLTMDLLACYCKVNFA